MVLFFSLPHQGSPGPMEAREHLGIPRGAQGDPLGPYGTLVLLCEAAIAVQL